MSKYAMSKFATREDRAEAAGFNAGMEGSNEENTHFSFFATPSETAAWESGKRRGEASKLVLDKIAAGKAPK
jgi:ribosome modulation factor